MERRPSSVFALVLVLLAGAGAVLYLQWPQSTTARAHLLTEPQPTIVPNNVTLTIPLDIKVYETIRRVDFDLDETLARVAKVMKKEAAIASDVLCNVKFVPETVSKFSDGFDGQVNSPEEFNSLFVDSQQGGERGRIGTIPTAPKVRQVRVVWGISWCDTGTTNIAGCSDQDGYRVVVTPVSVLRAGQLWAHEVGHTKALTHREDSGAVMQSMITTQSNELNAGECSKFRRRD